MKPENFTILKDLLFSVSGLVISEDKQYLLDSRLRPVLQKYEIADMDALAMKVKLNSKGPEAWDIVEAMTTNETSFFRDTRPFDMFRDVVLPDILEKNAATKKVRIWSAACSSGQEPYSLAMIIKEMGAKTADYNFEIVATDISKDILQTAQEGLYSQFEVQRGLPITMLVKYFTQEGEKWRINDDVKSMISYRQFNLLESMSLMGKFDIIFCRNVLIYFDIPTKGSVLGNMASILVPHGYLFLGGAETVMGISDRFVPSEGNRGLYNPNVPGASSIKAV